MSRLKEWFDPNAWRDYSSKVVYGRDDYPPKVREILKKYGDMPIFRIVACRAPIPVLFTTALDAVSFGEFKKRLENTPLTSVFGEVKNQLEGRPHDTLFHLDLRVEVVDSSSNQMVTILVEKNEVINMAINPKKPADAECEIINNLRKPLTLNKMLEGAKQIQGDKFFRYSAVDNNCQDFIMALLKGSNSGSEQDYAFVKQNTADLFKGLPSLRRFVNTITDVGASLNTAIQGTGADCNHVIQSVIFKKDCYTKQKALNWIKEYGYKHKKIDETDNYWRFRQLAPETVKRRGFKKFVTRPIGEEGIQFIIAYK